MNEKLEVRKGKIEAELDKLKSCDRFNESSIEFLKRQLAGSDFYTAPATMKYHHSTEGGLAEYSWRVYLTLRSLNENYSLGFDEYSMIIVGLLFNMSKMNTFVKGVKNKKVYSNHGSKTDSMGKYDWVSEEGWEMRELENRFLFGNSEQTSAYMINTFLKMSTEEYVAVLHSSGGMNFDSSQESIWEIFERYSLAKYLHIAVMMAMDEK